MTKKKTGKRYILWGVLALAVILLAVMPLMARQQQAEEGPQASILSANATVSSIRTAIHGGGTLEAGENEDITLPADVKIEEFLVKNGDMVREGDPLAIVDKVSVMTAITEVQSSMSQVRKQMDKASDEKAETEVSATAGGRVKLVYAKEGDRVESVMLAHGALAVLSLDSKMCVKLTTDSPLSAGEAVTVTLADGKAVTGRVESNLSGEIVVTVADKGYEVGQTVTVENAGTGTLDIHSPWKATAFAGTVSIAYAQPEQTLGSGAALFALKDTDYTAQREILAQTHREYEELLHKLFRMYETGVISAPCDGMVSGIDKDSAHLMAAQEEEILAQPLTAGEGKFHLVLLSAVTLNEDGCTGNSDCPLEVGSAKHDPSCVKACTGDDNCRAAFHVTNCPHNCTNRQGCTAKHEFHQDCCPEKCTGNNRCQATKLDSHLDYCPRRCTNKKGCSASYHLDTCPEKCTDSTECRASMDNHLTTCPKYCSRSDTCTATEHRDGCPKIVVKEYQGIVGVVTRVEPTGNVLYLALNNGSIGKVTFTNKWDFGALDLNNTSGAVPSDTPYAVGDASAFSQGDVVVVVLDEDGMPQVIPTGKQSSTAGGNMGMPSFNFHFSFSIPGMGGYGSSSSQTQLYDLKGDTLMTVTPQDTMTLTVAVDESDISSVKTGMLVEIFVNALPGETFEGEITKVARSGSGNGGSSKFDVEITLPREGEMLAGMSASAVISLYEKMNVLTLPAAALTEDGAKTVVYTALDKKTGDPVSPVEVTTGLSDGETVEILSGLHSGDTVYYAYYDTPEESDAVETDRIKMY